ncbi:MAG: DUF4330 family protein [Clostridia bacterium]|nr:DUF4330 family protein [Clostridia bacterium]
MGKKKARFNFLDFLLVLAVFALVAGIIWRQELSDKIEIRDIENTVTVECEFETVVGEDTADAAYNAVRFPEGSTFVYMNGVAVGTVEKKTTQAIPEGSDSEGKHPVKVEKLSLKLSVVSKDSGYYLEGGEKLFIDGEYRLHTKTTEFTVRIVSISE